MARRFGPRSAMVKRSDRIPTWVGFTGVATTIVGNASVLIGQGNAALLALRPFTIIRTRAIVQVESDQAAASETVIGAFGAIVVQEEAAGVGITALPRPLTELDAQWFVYQAFINSFLFGDGTGFLEPSGTTYEVDSKSMRKVGLSETIVTVAESNTGQGGIIRTQGRMLIKLH